MARAKASFQSTPPHGERLEVILRVLFVFSCFNPRPRTGSDKTATHYFKASGVSIHAPARGATALPSPPVPRNRFQSTPPHGERPGSAPMPSCSLTFQSTPPHGERPRSDRTAARDQSFNPRPRTGSDLVQIELPPEIKVSIHAPARGATP